MNRGIHRGCKHITGGGRGIGEVPNAYFKL